MVKVTVGVYKSYKNGGRNRFHRKKTHKEWKHYFIDVDEYEQGEYTFHSEWVSAFKAMILKRNQVYKKTFVCLECYGRFTAYVKKNQTDIETECPHCGEE